MITNYTLQKLEGMTKSQISAVVSKEVMEWKTSVLATKYSESLEAMMELCRSLRTFGFRMTFKYPHDGPNWLAHVWHPDHPKSSHGFISPELPLAVAIASILSVQVVNAVKEMKQ